MAEKFISNYTIEHLPSEGRMIDEWFGHINSLVSNDGGIYISGNNCGGCSHLFADEGVVIQLCDPYSTQYKFAGQGPIQLIGKETGRNKIKKRLESLLNGKLIEIK